MLQIGILLPHALPYAAFCATRILPDTYLDAMRSRVYVLIALATPCHAVPYRTQNPLPQMLFTNAVSLMHEFNLPTPNPRQPSPHVLLLCIALRLLLLERRLRFTLRFGVLANGIDMPARPPPDVRLA